MEYGSAVVAGSAAAGIVVVGIAAVGTVAQHWWIATVAVIVGRPSSHWS